MSKRLPEGWNIKSLKDVIESFNGSHLAKTKISDNGKFPVYGANGIVGYTHESNFNEKLIALGRVGSIGKVNVINEEAWITDNTIIVKPIDEIISFDYLKIFLKTVNYERLRTGTTQPLITKSSVLNLKIQLPPLEKQERIVSILEKAENAIEKREESKKLLDELVKSRFIEMFGEPIKNTKGWNWSKLEELGDWKSGGTPSRSKLEYFKGEIPWLSSGELNNKYCFDSNEHITKDAISNSAAKLIEKESLLLGMYDTAALKSTINMVECTCNQAIAYSKLSSELVNTVYVYYCIQMGKEFYKRQQRGVRQKNLNLSMIKELEIIMAPIELQNEFAEFTKKVDKLKNEMENSLKELEDNFNSLMQKAFKGEL